MGISRAIGGQTRNGIGRLDGATGLADSFDPNANDQIYSIAVQADGKILAGGLFTTIGGQTRSGFARLSNDTAALQNLAVTQTTVTWTRGGSSPQFTRVTFESSTDSVNYTPLGNGTVAGSNWTLTGLNLATAQNIYIRARGYYRGGIQTARRASRNRCGMPLLLLGRRQLQPQFPRRHQRQAQPQLPRPRRHRHQRRQRSPCQALSRTAQIRSLAQCQMRRSL